MLSEPLACGGAAIPEIADVPESTRVVMLSERLARGGAATSEIPG